MGSTIRSRGYKRRGGGLETHPHSKKPHLPLTQVWNTQLLLGYRQQYHLNICSQSTIHYRITTSAGAAMWVDAVAIYLESCRIGEVVPVIYFFCLEFDRGLNATFFLRLPAMWNLWPQKFGDAWLVPRDHVAKFCGHKYWNCDFYDHIGHFKIDAWFHVSNHDFQLVCNTFYLADSWIRFLTCFCCWSNSLML